MNRKETGIALRRVVTLEALLALALGLSISVGPPAVFAVDSDGDGLDDSLENLIGSDPQSENSDMDNWSDFEEVFIYGTDPTEEDTDCDAVADSEDQEPLIVDQDGAGTNPAVPGNFQSSGTRPSLRGTTPFVGVGVVAVSGGHNHVLCDIALYDNLHFTVWSDSRTSIKSRTGDGTFSNFEEFMVPSGNDLKYYAGGHGSCPGGTEILFEWDLDEWLDAEGFSVTEDLPEDVWIVTKKVGGFRRAFDRTSGELVWMEDRFGNHTDVNRNGNGEITSIDLPEGHTVTVTTYGTGRYKEIKDWQDPPRVWTFTYNVKDELAKVEDPTGAVNQFFYINSSETTDLNGNLVRHVLPTGRTAMLTEYDSSDRVSEQTVAGETATFCYDTGSTTVTDFAGNQTVWNFTPGARVVNSKVVSSNRDVRTGDPATWTTTYTHDGDELPTLIEFPLGNGVKFTWDANFCLTERRVKADVEAEDDNDEDLVWSYTYGSTYFQLEDSTDPNGNTTERTLSGVERVTQIDYPDITHPDPDVSITESMTWNAQGRIVTRTDGEGVVTRYEYYSSGEEKGLLHQVIRDYGEGKLNLTTEYGYDDARFLTSVADPDGEVWTFTVDELGRRTKATSPSPQSYETVFNLSLDGWLDSKDVENVDETNTRDTGNPWWTTSYAYDDAGRVIAVTREIDSGTTAGSSFEYDGNGKLTLVTRPEGNESLSVYDERGLLAERTRGYDSVDASTEKWVYDWNGNLSTYTNGRNKTWTRSYDSYDRLTGIETPLGHYREFSQDKNGRVTESRSYDSSDDLLAGRRNHYDELSRLYMVEDWLDVNEDGDWTDGGGEDAGEWVATSYTLDDRGLVTAIEDPAGDAIALTYDNARRKTQWADDLGNEVNWDYTNDSRVPTTIEEIELVAGTQSTQTFETVNVTDALHRVTETRVYERDSSVNYHATKVKMTSLGVVVEREDANGHKTYSEHDGLGRVTLEKVDMGGASYLETAYEFDDNGNLVLLTDDNGSETIFRYNDRDVRKEIEYDDAEKRTFTIAADDQVSGWTDENGTIVTNTYDDDGRLTARSITKANGVYGPTSESYTWDGLSRLSEAKNNDSTVQRSWDTLSRLVSETQGPNPIGQDGKTITYEYGDDGTRTGCTYFSGYELVYTSDAAKRWTTVEHDDGQNQRTLFTETWYGAGMRAGTTSYHGAGNPMEPVVTTETITYDKYRWVAEIAHEDSGASRFAGFAYGYDAVGNPLYVARSHDGDRGDIYRYDNANRLIGAVLDQEDPANDYDWSWGSFTDQNTTFDKKVDYQMDDVSNRTSVVETLPNETYTSVSYTSNALNQYTAIDATNRSHDDNGNLTDDGTNEYAYDYRNNLVYVDDGQTTLMTAAFDALGRRISKTVNGGNDTTYYFYDGEHAVEEYDDSDDLQNRFVYGQRMDDVKIMIGRDRADLDQDFDTSEFVQLDYHHDMLGSVTHVTDVNEVVVEQYEYTPYGKTTIRDGQGTDLGGQSDIGNPYMFTARRLDALPRLYHYRRRTYDPAAGRFLQRDPVAHIENSTQGGLCHYEYCGSHPVARVDPMGKNWLGALLGFAGGLGYGIGHELGDLIMGDGFSFSDVGGAIVGGTVAGGLLPAKGVTFLTTLKVFGAGAAGGAAESLWSHGGGGGGSQGAPPGSEQDRRSDENARRLNKTRHGGADMNSAGRETWR